MPSTHEGTSQKIRTTMTFFYDGECLFCQQILLALQEKELLYKIIPCISKQPPKELLKVSSYGFVPTLIDRELVLYVPSIILEYLEERFPFPELFPRHPVARAETRKILLNIERELYTLLEEFIVSKDCSQMKEYLKALSPLFDNKLFFYNDDFSMLDCAMIPFFHRLLIHEKGFQLPEGIQKYVDYILNRPSYQSVHHLFK